MTGSIEVLFLAVVVFVAGHFALDLPQGRAVLVDKLGENGKALFSTVSPGEFIWMLLAYRGALHVEIWPQAHWAFWISNVALLISIVLLVYGYTGPNPTAIGQESILRDDPLPLRGIITGTRHSGRSAFGRWRIWWSMAMPRNVRALSSPGGRLS